MMLPDIHADFHARIVVATDRLAWEASPSRTVWRKPLYREGGEYGPVTSLVRYAAGGHFRPHAHPQGEEILVLEGVFSDEHGDYPAGTYLLNPDGSEHAPFSCNGCTLFVRLRQYAGSARPRLRLNTSALAWQPGPVPGVTIKSLYAQAGYPEQMALVRHEPGARLPAMAFPEGGELLVLEGALEDKEGAYPIGAWLRLPPGYTHTPFSQEGCVYYRRLGGLGPAT
ncbi:MAG: cupin domain-containing protein [Candidatus Competibacteraceae bacterium]